MEERVGNLPYLKTHILATSVLNLSQKIQPSRLVDPVGELCSCILQESRGKLEGQQNPAQNYKKKKRPLKMSIKWLLDLKEENGSKFIVM
jgi:hypothetical protein